MNMEWVRHRRKAGYTEEDHMHSGGKWWYGVDSKRVRRWWLHIPGYGTLDDSSRRFML